MAPDRLRQRGQLRTRVVEDGDVIGDVVRARVRREVGRVLIVPIEP
jgi:hypothetical protein